MISVSIDDRRLRRNLRRIPRAGRPAVLRKAAYKGATVIRDEARRRAPNRSGNLQRNIVRVVLDVSESAAKVGVSWALKDGPSRQPGFYGLFLEKGTRERVQSTTGRSTGSVRAQPFLAPAMEAMQAAAGRIAADEVKLAVDREIT